MTLFYKDAFTTNKEHALTLPTTWVMGCAYSPSGTSVACGGLDNKLTVFPLTMEDDSQSRKKVVGTHTSYTSCCLFPGSDNQVLIIIIINIFILIIIIVIIVIIVIMVII